jgi:hypothetical protein
MAAIWSRLDRCQGTRPGSPLRTLAGRLLGRSVDGCLTNDASQVGPPRTALDPPGRTAPPRTEHRISAAVQRASPTLLGPSRCSQPAVRSLVERLVRLLAGAGPHRADIARRTAVVQHPKSSRLKGFATH